MKTSTNKCTSITQEELKKCLVYDEETGVFTSKRNGNEIGSLDHYGYMQITIDSKVYKAHRLAWLYLYGYFPEHQVDHINGDRKDNRACNLRHVTNKCNHQNMKKFSTNTSGFTGVHFDKSVNKWRASIVIDRRNVYIGIHSDPVSAALHRCHFEECCPDWACDERRGNFKKLQGMGYLQARRAH